MAWVGPECCNAALSHAESPLPDLHAAHRRRGMRAAASMPPLLGFAVRARGDRDVLARRAAPHQQHHGLAGADLAQLAIERGDGTTAWGVAVPDLPGCFTAGETLDEALATCDVVSLITSVTDATRGMISTRELALMRSDAYLVNTARAALIDHEALGQALEAGEIAGCALDALPIEPAPPEEPARSWPNTILQPHAAFYSEASELRSFDNPAEDVARVLAGEEPLGLLQ